MSDLQRKWAKAKFDATAQINGDERMVVEEKKGSQPLEPGETIDDDDSSSASSVSSTGTIRPSPGMSLSARPQGVSMCSGLEQIPWTIYFERELFLRGGGEDGTGPGDPSVTYHAYLTSPVGKGPLFVTHHGAGASGLSFAVLGAEIRKRLPTAGILSLDARGHGSTKVVSTKIEVRNKEPTLDFSLATLAADLQAVIMLTSRQMKWPSLRPIVLVGHSLGGAVVAEVANQAKTSCPQIDQALLCYAVLDVVEGSAMDALQSMHTYLATRPSGFGSLRDAINWHVRSRTVRNVVSARTSVPALLVRAEKSEDENSNKGRLWRWRTDLAATQSFWEGWFVGLSKKFLTGRGGKMLLLAGTDRLDTQLTIGQMQGKYALQVFPEAGHFIHEDLPEKTAVALVEFQRRNDRSALVLPPKVSDLLAQGKRV